MQDKQFTKKSLVGEIVLGIIIFPVLLFFSALISIAIGSMLNIEHILPQVVVISALEIYLSYLVIYKLTIHGGESYAKKSAIAFAGGGFVVLVVLISLFSYVFSHMSFSGGAFG